MAPARKRTNNIARRRRLDDEDESKSLVTELADDSQSDISAPSDVDADADADNSDLSDADSGVAPTEGKPKRKANGTRSGKAAPAVSTRQPSPPIARSDAAFTALKDTEAMMNGLSMTDAASKAEEVDFETGAPAESAPAVGPPSARPETLGDRRRREHEEYKKKRDSDPAFIPNRGAFFMHDSRSAPGQNGFRPVGGRGRGRGGIGGPFSPANLRQHAPEATDSPWQHDLHEAVNAPHQPAQHAPPSNMPTQHAPHAPQHAQRAPFAPVSRPPQTRNFSTTVHTHNAVVRILLPSMKAPVTFQNVPIKSHTRLPNHRPPLRRDKPVRISLPPSAPRYIFPTVERSFIFIPRALRPNQQGFGRGRGRFGSIGGGGFSSRRTSVYGGSVYSPSVALSRRSSIARDNMVSPAGSIMSRNGSFIDPNRPVVRLPPGGVRMPTGPAIISPTNGSYPPPQKPAFRENWAQGQLPMHQPRPQKNVNVAGIESPASMNFNPPQQQEQQPFHQQVPAHINGAGPSGEQPGFYQHARQPSYSGQISTGTPLNNIPERAIHAPAFQPFQPGYQPQPFVPGGYYYPPSAPQQPYMAPGGMVPMFVPGAQQPYAMPAPAPAVAPPAPAAAGPPNMVAVEQNGMTFYMDANQLPYAPPADAYAAQPSYTMPGMGGMMTPAPDGAYYYPQQMQPTAFYPQQ
ncbi:uncharacterized protein M421DRAFT_90439 [Didymella exigua CBS 183.55]|uniref:Btz domain-containing protein n=1 Tax=Didymella exigua CBS 183.55 TaxID=1150837 RepID=A0A6A5RYK3_9PLEO|nr:uncharacterized protein M421DRAFT_90439 [Didymella exigua CBS 183.55]KAF1931386.1 hypothetical protein M421DRAFT_90439 [Didymella exigua CBS 183.55]